VISTKPRQLLKKISKWVNNNKTEFILLAAVLLLALALRVWRIDEYLPFLGDEGRDVRVVRRFLTNFDLMFIGPRTSIGDMYLGPLYYYLIAPFLLLWNFSPVGPAVFVSLVSVGTVFLIWYMVREWFGKYGAMAAAFLYAISPIVILHARHSWNPNIMPFLVLLCVYSAWRIWQKKDFKWLLVLGASFGSAIQSHYLGLLIGPTLAVVWLISFISVYKSSDLRKFIVYSLGALGIFLLLQVPLVLFDWRHGWHNTLSLKTFFFNRQTTVSAKPWNAIPGLWPLWQGQIVTRLLTAKNGEVGTFIAGTLIVTVGYLSYLYHKSKNYMRQNSILLIVLWAVFGLLGIGLLKQSIYDHYFGFLFPLPFLVFGLLFQELYTRKLKIVAIILLAGLTFLSLQQNPLKDQPQRQMQKVQEIDKSIIADSQNKPFNFALIAKQNYEEGYLYYLEMWNAQVREIDSVNISGTLTDQLYVVCEDPVCEPINNAKAEIANFGWQKIDKQWEVGGTKVFRIVHSEKTAK
jgi:4-amino-4-deoxy-L-arabinose transferase-like glycosyltransferase